MSASGFVYLVGAGPWEPGLLTVRGRALLEVADVVVHDYLVNPELLELAPTDARIISVGRPPSRMTQDEINAELIRCAQTGLVVVRLKGGDPFVFGRGGEEAEALVQAGVGFEVVPGVTAAVASAAYAGIPVTHRLFGSTLGFCTGHFRGERGDDGVDWQALAQMSTIVLYMAAGRLESIAAELIAAGRAPETPVALIRWATRPDQRTVVTRLDEAGKALTESGLEPPLSIIVGDVVSLRTRIGWYEQKSLFGVRTVITRSKGQQGALANRLRELGAEVNALPTITFEAGSPEVMDEAIRRLADSDWVIFTSANGVDFFLEAVYERGFDARVFGGTRIACIGPATARRLAERGLTADRVPSEFVAEALIEEFLTQGVEGQRILIPRAEVARDILPDRLREAGADVHVAAVYRTIAPEVNEALRLDVASGGIDVVTFTSSSTVKNFCGLFQPEELSAVMKNIVAACIGPITAREAEEAGFLNRVVADTYTIPGLIEALDGWGKARTEEVKDAP
jgi:uroporphyrinogen III methyltransferase/synthase